ncbi:hypothetical protein F4801DRAFT_577939 [Xylaria longipes]|nr:hypothetical protein F4801DRAFT_577939 [Xylaria longipes]
MDDVEDKAEESEENISPDAEKSEIRFTLERRQNRDGNDDDNNGGNNRDSDRRGRNRGGGENNQNRRNGEGDFNGPGSRFQGGGDGRPPFFHQNDGGDRKPGDDGGGNGNGKGDGRDSGRGGKFKGEVNNGEGRGNREGGSNGGGGGNDNGNGGGRGGRGGGGGGGSGDDRGGSDSGPDSTSSISPPPPSSSTTSTTTAESTTTEASTTTPVVTSTSTPTPEATTSSVSQTSTIPILTPLPALADTAPSSIVPPISSAPDGALGTTQTLTSVSATDTVDATTPVPTQTNASPGDGFGRGRGGHRGNGDNNKGNDKEGGLNPTSERILVAVGAIGVFIVFCFIGWIIYRTLKKSKQSGRQSWLSRLIPWRGRSAENDAQPSDSSYEPKEPLPAYDLGNNNSMEAFGYYDQGKGYPFGPEGMTYQSTTTLQNGRVVWQTPEVDKPLQQQASLQNQYPQANDQTTGISDVNLAMRSRIPDTYYNQSESARQPSDVYNSMQRQVYRASEISSLSSGFGDGDIIMPPPNVIPKPPVAQMMNNPDTGNRPFSWVSRRRETVSTTTSERPTRFRSVNSWVDQQKERIKRANSRTKAREEVPALPQISYK